MSVAQPLAGKRILITRAKHQAGRLAEALEARGAEVLRLATIEIIAPGSYDALDAALRSLDSFDWLILTSTNGVAALGNRIRSLGLPLKGLDRLRVAAIGPATASAARQLGLPVHVMPKDYIAEAVVAALKDSVAGKRILVARAAVARDVIPQQLAQCGARVEVVEAYRTVVPSDSIRRLPELFGDCKLPDAITFTSSSTVRNFFALLSAAETARPSGLRAVSIGPVTTRTLREHEWEPSGEATHYDIPGVVEACEKLLSGL